MRAKSCAMHQRIARHPKASTIRRQNTAHTAPLSAFRLPRASVPQPHFSKNGEAGHRSQCLSHAKRALYHLSYIPMPEHQQVSRCWGLRAPWGIIEPRRHRTPRPSPCNTSKLSRQAHRTEQKRCACRESNPGHKHGRLV